MTSSSDRQRLHELLADEQLGQLSVEDRAELQALRERHGPDSPDALGELLVAIDRVDGDDGMPGELADRIAARGRAVVGAGSGSAEPGVSGRIGPSRGGGWMAFAIAAGLIAAVSLTVALITAGGRSRAERDWAAERTVLEERLATNTGLLAESRQAVEQLEIGLAAAEDLSEAQRIEIAERAQRQLEMAERLATATANLDSTMSELRDARLTIARFEAPVDPATLRADRRQLMEVPGTVTIAWAPFDVEGLPPPEQGDVEGDVVWNDELQEGYLRFVGLDVNDPSVEQYQVWVIDERGLEQKVGGGVFNATAQGEVIVPIEPWIDIGRVALFAITIEEPGGTVVPDLQRRAVVAPRG